MLGGPSQITQPVTAFCSRGIHEQARDGESGGGEKGEGAGRAEEMKGKGRLGKGDVGRRRKEGEGWGEGWVRTTDARLRLDKAVPECPPLPWEPPLVCC